MRSRGDRKDAATLSTGGIPATALGREDARRRGRLGVDVVSVSHRHDQGRTRQVADVANATGRRRAAAMPVSLTMSGGAGEGGCHGQRCARQAAAVDDDVWHEGNHCDQGRGSGSKQTSARNMAERTISSAAMVMVETQQQETLSPHFTAKESTGQEPAKIQLHVHTYHIEE